MHFIIDTQGESIEKGATQLAVCIFRFCIHGFNHLQMWRANCMKCTVPFYIGDLSICRFWYLWGGLEPIQLGFQLVVQLGKTVFHHWVTWVRRRIIMQEILEYIWAVQLALGFLVSVLWVEILKKLLTVWEIDPRKLEELRTCRLLSQGLPSENWNLTDALGYSEYVWLCSSVKWRDSLTLLCC